MCRSWSCSSAPFGQELGRKQALDEVVVAPVAGSPGESQDAGLAECLEQGPDLVRRPPVPVDRGPRLDIGRRQLAVGPDPLEELGDERGVLVERAGVMASRAAIPGDPVVGQLGRRDEAQALVVRLVEGPLLVEQGVGPLAPVALDPGEQHQVVVPPGDLERIELERSEPGDDGHDAGGSRRQ